MPEENKNESNGEEVKKAEEKLKNALRTVLTEEAHDRMTNIKIANQELYFAAAQHVISIYNDINRKVTDVELRHILKTILSKRERKTSITFDRK